MGTERRTQERRPVSRRDVRTSGTEEATAVKSNTTTERGKELRKAMDDLIDEIDEALEENAEEFVNNYVQKGGE